MPCKLRTKLPQPVIQAKLQAIIDLEQKEEASEIRNTYVGKYMYRVKGPSRNGVVT